MIIEYDSILINPAFITAIEYGDYSALSENETQQLNTYLAEMPKGHKTWQFSEDASENLQRDAITWKNAYCVEAKIFMNHSDI